MADLKGTTLEGIQYWSYGSPTFTALIMYFQPGQSFIAEKGAMAWMHPTITMQTAGRKGGLLKGLAVSALGGESFFVNTFTATGGPGEIAFVGPFMGDVRPVNLQGQGYIVRSGGFLASGPNVQLDTKWQGIKGFVGMRDAVMLRASGQGTIFLSSFGAMLERDLQQGEVLSIDNGHVVAFQDHIPYSVRAAGGMKSTILGGEGMVVDMTGPGKVFIQTRQLQVFAEHLARVLPNRG